MLRRELAQCEGQLNNLESQLGALKARRSVRLALALAAPVARILRTHRVDGDSEAAAAVEEVERPLFYWPSLTDFHSPVPDTRSLSQPATRSRIWPEPPPERPGIDWQAERQLQLLSELGKQTPMRIPEEPTDDPLEYFAPNPSFDYYDSWAMAAMLRHLRPSRMIEAGSGWTSLLAARVNREYLAADMELTCIDPFPQPFLSGGAKGISRIIEQPLEQTPLSVFERLAPNDVLFIDSTHTVKTGGDVVFLFGEVIPRLRKDVFVHVHDIFLPRDYPEQWALSGWSWNEQYLLQAFLAFNSEFEIVLALAWLAENHPDALAAAAPPPNHYRKRFGASLWFRRSAPQMT